MAEGLGYGSAWSNEAFELWYCLHFIFLNTGISRSEYIKQIEKALKLKGNRDNYHLLQQYGNEDMAKLHAARLRRLFIGTNYAAHNPCTMVDKLVDELQHPECFL